MPDGYQRTGGMVRETIYDHPRHYLLRIRELEAELGRLWGEIERLRQAHWDILNEFDTEDEIAKDPVCLIARKALTPVPGGALDPDA
jgi:hypothetical protein